MPMPMQETEAEKFFLFFFRHHKNGIINKFSMSKHKDWRGKLFGLKCILNVVNLEYSLNNVDWLETQCLNDILNNTLE